MAIRKKHIIILFSVLSISIISVILVRMKNVKTSNYEVFVHETSRGFGYSITYNEKMLIKQDYIPAIQDVQSFCSSEDALKVATFVKEKLNKRENPKVTLIDLKQFRIKLNCLH